METINISDEEIFGSSNVVRFKRDISSVTSDELTKMEVIPKKTLLSPWLKEKQTAMVYAPPGTGKTFFALNCAHSLVSGKKFLKFTANPLHPNEAVLYVDGEMDIEELQSRWKKIVGNDLYPNMRFYTPEIFPDYCVPKISNLEDQAFYEDEIKKHNVKVVIFDNLSMLSDLDENKASEYNIIQNWFIKLKNSGTSVILIHHTNKGGQEARGTSKLADNLNSVLFLEQIKDEDKNHGARFKVKYQKKRGFHGEDAEEFDAWLDDKGIWHADDPVFNNRLKFIEFYTLGMSISDIVKTLGISQPTAYRYRAEAEKAGMIKVRPYGQ